MHWGESCRNLCNHFTAALLKFYQSPPKYLPTPPEILEMISHKLAFVYQFLLVHCGNLAILVKDFLESIARVLSLRRIPFSPLLQNSPHLIPTCLSPPPKKAVTAKTFHSPALLITRQTHTTHCSSTAAAAQLH